MDKAFDVVVIGAGPGGYVAAIRAAQLGFKTAVIEREHFGGICLNWGCIPTKALLRMSEMYHMMQNSATFGISCSQCDFDIRQMVGRSRAVVSQLVNGVKNLMHKNNIMVIEGHARLLGKSKVEVTINATKSSEKLELAAKHIILATGARPRVLSTFPVDHETVWDYKDAMVPKALPKSLLIVGSGAIGTEFASFYHALGVQVTIVEILDRILPNEDEEISAFMFQSLTKWGINIHLNTQVNKVDVTSGSAEIDLTHKDGKVSRVKCDKILSAVGVVPNTENLGLKNTKIEQVNGGYIKIDEYMKTDELGVYAIGDITTAPLLAHKASHQGVICVENIAKLPHVHPIKPENIPGCTYSYPQVASVGYTEKQALAKGLKIKVGRFPFIGNGKAVAIGEVNGMAKLIFAADTDELLGAHLVGAEVTEMIHSLVIAKTSECTMHEIVSSIFPHPTLSETIYESVLAGYGRALHI
ncbi:Dihydrolipoyl dehydrogenase [Alphaproteobacteria bacterium]